MSKDFLSGAYLGASAALIAALVIFGEPYHGMVLSNLETIYQNKSLAGLEKPIIFWSLVTVSLGAVLMLLGSCIPNSKSK
tara:strand:+ start:3274 stop:3513 length:240 start_codon:yes stop_codon:yes gene_type:complete